jgi:hypothetical protein
LKSGNLDDFSRFAGEGLIKSGDKPVQTLTGEQKAALNRKGNVFFNDGDIETARRIFVTTGYSDGLSRVGDYYAEKGNSIEAIKLYWLARNRRKSEPLIEKMASLVGMMLADDKEQNDG